MTRHYGSQSMVAPLQTVIMRRPDRAFADADPAAWHYTDRPDLQLALQEHDYLANILHEFGSEIVYHAAPLPNQADAIYVHDPVLISDRGAILLRMGKPLRRGEEEALGQTLSQMGVPVHYRLHGDALAEGGDLMWLDHHTLIIGQGFRTNAEGLRQLEEAFAGQQVNLIPVDLPFFTGPEACLHLMSFVSIVDHDLAVTYMPLMPVPLFQLLKDRGFRFVEVPDEEFLTMGPNVLALAPGQCVMLDKNPITQARLEEAGCKVKTYRGDEISLKAEGGATCLTRPVLRG